MTCRQRDSIVQGAVAPYHLRFDVTDTEPDASDVDFLQVNAALFDVQLPDGTAASWPAVIELATASMIRLSYAFQAGDLDQLGEYQATPTLQMITGGQLFASERRFTVIPLHSQD